MPDQDIDIIAGAAGRVWEKSAKTFYHGSTTPDLATLKATQPNMGAAGVYGADNIDWAALYALAKDRKGMAVIGGANPRLLIHKDNALLPEGNVYEYDSEQYAAPPETDPNLGWAVPNDVTPTKTHKVKLTDHMRNIEQFDDKETLRKRFAELAGKAWAKHAAANTAVIIRGNPKFVANNASAEAFYAKLQKHMEQQGYEVTQDAGEPHTVPAAANVWLGHSRGVDRFRFAPDGTRTIGLGAPGGINHPDDAAMAPGDVPTAAHYKLTPAMIKALNASLQKQSVDFTPDYTPEQLENLGVYDALYRNQGPRLASLGEWKPEWVSEHDPKGWAQWYKRYSGGRRIPDEDDRQIKRWSSFKARHGSSFTKNPTPRRGWALRNWGIDPAKLVPNEARNGVVGMMDEYQRKAMQKYVQGLGKQAATPPQPADMNVGGSVSMPVTPKLPSLATPEMTNQGIKGWMRNNYSGSMSGIGQNRQNFFSQIQDHINPPQKAPGFLGSLFGPKQTPQPNLTPQYTQFLNNKNTELMGRVGVPYETQTPTTGGLLNSGVQMNEVGKRILTLPDNPSNQYIGQGYFTPQNPKDGPPTDLYKWGPAMPRSLVGLHERQHLLQELPSQAAQNAAGFKPADRLLSVMNGAPEGSFMEPAAVMTEMAHAADAAKQVTGKPVPGDMQFSPGYSMPIDEMRREGERAGVLSGRHTAQEALNTPAGQAWLRMQMQQHADAAAMEKRNGAAAASKAWAKQADLLPGIQLQDHQQRIADEVSGVNPRMLVYHGLGSGKSLSALAAAEAAQRQYGGNYGIVAPASLRGNFQKEVKKFTNSQPEIMSYTGLGMGKQFKDQPETLIMDEAARLRNPNAASTRAAFQASQKADRLMLLTGTPITNEPKDLASIISMLNKQEITPEQFEKDYVGYKKVWPSLWGWMRGATPGMKPIIRNGPKLRSLLEGKVDYQPSKTPEGVNINEQTIRVPLSPEQQKIQKAVRTKVPPGFLWKMDQEFPLSRQELSKLNSFMTGLRQVGLSTQPFRADHDPYKAFQQSAKMQEAFKNLKGTLDSDPRKKALIYSNFVDAGLGPYAAGLEHAGIPHAFFHGGVSPKVRQAAVDAYNAGKLRALLIGPAGAEGISTKGTSLIQLMDPHWNEARTQQAQGRGLRFDSHVGLPDELKNVAVQRYLSSSQDPSMVGKLMGYKRERTGDEVLERLTAEKEKLNEEFRNLLREVGSKHKQDPQLAEKVSQRCTFN